MPNRLQGQFHQPQPTPEPDASTPPTSAWTKPVLSVYGDVRRLTMGPTPNVGESGSPGTLKA